MKLPVVFLLFAGLLSGQNEALTPSPFEGLPGLLLPLVRYIEIAIEASRIEKTVNVANEQVDYNPTALDSFASPGNDVGLLTFGGNRPAAVKRRSAAPAPIGSTPFPYSPVDPVIAPFYGSYPNGQTLYVPSYRPGSASLAPSALTPVQPVAPPDPEMIFLDGLGNSLIAVDLTTLTVLSQVVIPSTTGPFGIRPSATGPSNEVWVLNPGNESGVGAQVSVVDLAGQSVVAGIFTPSIPQSTSVPIGIVFTNDGATAIEAFKYLSPDPSGNNGAVVVFDAAGRTVTSTLPLKYAPGALLMAPDGLTAYVLSSNGMITYYDVLSGTADLSVSTYTPGMSGGYPGSSNQAFIHPDGTRLFWNANYVLEVFDLTKRQVTGYFSSGLPSTSSVSMTMSQDGDRVYMSNGSGDVVILDTQYGTVLNSYQRSSAVQVFGGPPVAP